MEQGQDIQSSCMALHQAAQGGHLKVVKELIKNGANVDAQNKYGGTALHTAAWNGHLEVVQELVRRHPDLVHTRDKRNMTPLHSASCGHTVIHVEMAKELLRHGADVTAVNVDNQTPLDIARMRNAGTGLVRILEEVVERNANK